MLSYKIFMFGLHEAWLLNNIIMSLLDDWRLNFSGNYAYDGG